MRTAALALLLFLAACGSDTPPKAPESASPKPPASVVGAPPTSFLWTLCAEHAVDEGDADTSLTQPDDASVSKAGIGWTIAGTAETLTLSCTYEDVSTDGDATLVDYSFE